VCVCRARVYRYDSSSCLRSVEICAKRNTSRTLVGETKTKPSIIKNKLTQYIFNPIKIEFESEIRSLVHYRITHMINQLKTDIIIIKDFLLTSRIWLIGVFPKKLKLVSPGPITDCLEK